MGSRLTACAAAFVAFAASGCGGSTNNSPTTPTPTPAPSGAITINIVGQNGSMAFSPNPASAGGQMVVFRNSDGVTHRVVLNDGSIDTGNIAPGATSAAVAMPASGTNYHCSIHPGMIGAINPASGGAPPPCEGIYCTGF
jgi:plastocyanin